MSVVRRLLETRMPGLPRIACIAASLLGVTLTTTAIAHDSRPLAIEIAEREDGVYSLAWRLPPVMPIGTEPLVTLAGRSCRVVGSEGAPVRPVVTGDPGGQSLHTCPEGLGGHAVAIHYPVVNPSLSTLLRVTWRSGESRVLVAAPDESSIELPARAEPTQVARSYLLLGVRHILAGPDHLLFLACLLWIAATPRRVVLAITGFTIGHSLTLSLATLGVLRIPVAPMEACIALSVMFLAAEIVRGRRHTALWRYPLAAATAFGLLHGFGFASVLEEIGLPHQQVVVPLLFFNLGVEVGQLLFAGAALGLAAAWRRRGISSWLASVVPAAARVSVPVAGGYVVGTIAGLWFVGRATDMLG